MRGRSTTPTRKSDACSGGCSGDLFLVCVGVHFHANDGNQSTPFCPFLWWTSSGHKRANSRYARTAEANLRETAVRAVREPLG